MTSKASHNHTRRRSLTLAAALCALAVPNAFAADPHTGTVNAKLTVISNTTMNCHAGVCDIHNHGRGRLTPFGKVTFTTHITADGNNPPCGARSQWVERLIRTIHTAKGTLVLHEAGLQCPQPGGPQVNAVWALDSIHSTGVFAGATGHGTDTAHPLQGTDAFHGTITLAS